MKNLKMIKNIYLLLIVCSILVGAVLLIWPQMGVSVMCKVYGAFLASFPDILPVTCSSWHFSMISDWVLFP